MEEEVAAVVAKEVVKPSMNDLVDTHRKHHFGTDRTFELVTTCFGKTVSREVKNVVDQCKQCPRICPTARNPYWTQKLLLDALNKDLQAISD